MQNSNTKQKNPGKEKFEKKNHEKTGKVVHIPANEPIDHDDKMLRDGLGLGGGGGIEDVLTTAVELHLEPTTTPVHETGGAHSVKQFHLGPTH